MTTRLYGDPACGDRDDEETAREHLAMLVNRDNVEFLRAWEDGTWDVESYDCPEDPTAQDFIPRAEAWAIKTLAPQGRYRKVILWAVYAVHQNGMDT